MIRVNHAQAAAHSAGTPSETSAHLEALTHDLRTFLDEVQWFLSRDWQQIIRDPAIATALLRRSTKAALVSEDIQADLLQRIGHTSTADPSGALPYHRLRCRPKGPLPPPVAVESSSTNDSVSPLY